MKMVKLSDFYPYDRNKGGIQELHHKIESKTLQYWGEDSGILIGITPIYKRRLWSEEVKVVNDKMTNMKTRTYEGVQHGDWVRCVLCGAQMLLPCGADRTIEGATEVANLLVKYNAFKIESGYLTGSYEQFWIIKESVCPAIKGEAGYSEEEFDKVNKENKDPELESINSFNDTVKKNQ